MLIRLAFPALARYQSPASPDPDTGPDAERRSLAMTGSGEATWADFAQAVFEEAEARGRRSKLF